MKQQASAVHPTQLGHQFILEVLVGQGLSLMRGTSSSSSSREAAEIPKGLSVEGLGLSQQAHQNVIGGARVLM